MQVKIEKENILVRKKEEQEKSSVWIEQDILVPDTKPDILKILKVSTMPFITKVESQEGKLKVQGRLNSYILYRSVDETTPYKTVTYSYDFNEVIKSEKINSNSLVNIKPSIRNIIFQAPNERKISLKNELFLDMDVEEERNISLLKNILDEKNVELERKELKLENIVTKSSKNIDIREEIVLDTELPDIDEIAFENHRISNVEYKKNYNKVIVKGDLEGYLVYTTKNADRILNKEEYSIPFTTFFEIADIKDEYRFDINLDILNFIPRKNTDNVTSNSVIVDSSINCRLYVIEDKKMDVINDFYFLDKEENITKTKERIKLEKLDKKISHNIDHTFKDVISETDNIIEYNINLGSIISKIVDNNCFCEGIMKISVLVENSKTKEINCKTLELPIEHKEELKGIKCSGCMLDIDSISLTKQDKNIVLKGNLLITLKEDNICSVDIVENIETENLDSKDLDDIIIYIVKEGDTLFSIAKKYKTTVKNILKSNDINDPQKSEIGKKLIIIR